jgi:hypothetical protein
MDPQVSVGAFHQASWPGAGDVDDCWAIADLQAIHAVAPWLRLVTVPAYREAAGNPDLPGPTGGSIADSRRAIRILYPGLGADYMDQDPVVPFAALLARLKAGAVASVSVMNGKLPPSLRFGTYAGGHRVAVFYDNPTLRVLNPLAPAHQRAKPITPDQLKAACLAFAPGIRAVVFPDPDTAFRTHPLLGPTIAAAVKTLQDRIQPARDAHG